MLLKRWSQPYGYRETLKIGFPMIISMSSFAFMQFTDSVFLANYSIEAIAAVAPAGFTAFMFSALFFGTSTYVNVFIAQYSGSGQNDKVGSSLWQGIYFVLLSSLILIGISFLGETIFTISNHPAELIGKETIYFKILTAGAGVRLLSMVLSCFYSGLGKTRPVMIINIISACLNIPLDYALINGHWFFPELGIKGAAIATVTASLFPVIMFSYLIFNKKNNRIYSVLSAFRFDRKLFLRFLRYGTPGGASLFFDILAFSFFMLIIGRFGKNQLAATNVAIAVYHLLFMPYSGLSVATSTLVGRAIGKGRPDDAVTATKSSLRLTLIYGCIITIIFFTFPEYIAYLFRPRGITTAEFNILVHSISILLRFIAFFIVAEGIAETFVSTLQGSGDTKFIVKLVPILVFSILIIPVYVEINYLGFGLYGAFTTFCVYYAVLASILYLRYRQGKWKTMKVIEMTK